MGNTSFYAPGRPPRRFAPFTSLVFFILCCTFASVQCRSNDIEYRTFYLSSIRGNDTLNLCTYEHPCSTLARFNVDIFRGSAVELRLLSGKYSFQNLTLEDETFLPLRNLQFNGQRDCWPGPENSTACAGSDVVVTEITLRQNGLVSLDASNLVFRPNGTAINGTSVLIDSGERYLDLLSVLNVTIDAQESSASHFEIVLKQRSTTNSAVISGVRFINFKKESELVVRAKAARLQLDTFTADSPVALGVYMWSNEAKSYRFANLELSNLTFFPNNSGVTSLEFNNVTLSLGASNSSEGNKIRWPVAVSESRISHCKFVNFESSFTAHTLTIESSSFVGTFINVTSNTAAYMGSRSVNLSNNDLISSTFLFKFANVSQARGNRFESGYDTVEGVELAPFIVWETKHEKNVVPSFTVDARGNWWGQPTGPSTCCNPGGNGTAVLWLTHFDPWCIDPQCDHLSSNASLSTAVPSMSFANFPSCSTEVFCPAETPVVSYITLAVFILPFLGCVIAFIVFMIRHSENPLLKYRRILTVLAITSIIAGAAWLTNTMLTPPAAGRNAVSAYAKEDLRNDSIRFVVASSIFIFSKVILLFISLRNTKVPLAGVQHMFVYLAVESIVILAGVIFTEAVLPSIRILNDTYPLSLFSVLVTSGRLPSPNMWLIQGVDTAVIAFFNIAILILIRQVMQVRDFGELTDISRDADARASLLGGRKTSVLQGEKTLLPARRIAWFNVTRILLLPVATTLLLVANIIPDPVSFYIIFVSVAHSALSIMSFVLFFWFNYRPVFLMTSGAVTVCLGIIYLGFVVYFEVLADVFKFARNTYGQRIELILPATIFGILVALADFISGIWQIRYTIWASPILAGDINSAFERHLEGLYEYNE